MYEQAFQAFLASDQSKEAIISATKASWGGSGYSVELFADGHFRVLWNGEIGNLYQSPGRLLRILPLTEDEYSEDFEDSCFENAINQLKEQWAEDAAE
jgi:hypothetical protein